MNLLTKNREKNSKPFSDSVPAEPEKNLNPFLDAKDETRKNSK